MTIKEQALEYAISANLQFEMTEFGQCSSIGKLISCAEVIENYLRGMEKVNEKV